MKVAAQRPVWAWLAILAAVAAAVAGLSRLALVPDYTDRLRDDAYYEFAWAANLASGYGPMVSDGTTTSGVQLLWSAALAPLSFCFGPAALPLLAPWLGLLLHVLAAGMIARLGRDRVAASCAALCWLGNPLLVRECQNGQETALACLLLLWLWFRRRAAEPGFFVLALLASLARTDLLGFVAALSLVRHGRRWWRGLLTPAVIVLSLMALNVGLGGGLAPDSAAPMAWLWHSNHALAVPSLAETAATWWWYARPVLLGGPWAMASAMGSALAVFAVVRPWWPCAWRAVPALLVVAAFAAGAGDLLSAGWVALLLLVFPARRRRGVPRDLAALLLGGLVLLGVHWALRWYPRDYYIAPLVVLATAALLRFGRVRLVLLVFALAQLIDLPRVRAEPLAGQEAMALAGRHLAEVLPAQQRVGCFNSGILTFTADVLRRSRATRRAVVNLDGVVDARAFAALRRGRLADWLDEQDVRYVLDNPVQFATDPRLPHANGPWFAPDFDPARDLLELARFVVPAVGVTRPGTGGFRLYWRRGRGEPPVLPAAARDLGSWRDGRCVWWPARAGQRLVIERQDGEPLTLAAVDCDTTVIVAVPPVPRSTGRLFVAGEAQPLLVLPRD